MTIFLDKSKEYKMADRKMAFYEIRGLALEAQLAFERMQDAVMRNMTPAELTIKIAITPPDDDELQFGRIAYRIGTKETPVSSKTYHTFFKGGRIIADGIDDSDACQLDLELPQPTILNLKEASK